MDENIYKDQIDDKTLKPNQFSWGNYVHHRPSLTELKATLGITAQY